MKIIKQTQMFLLIICSVLAGIDDFTCDPKWDKTKSLWQNAGKLAEKKPWVRYWFYTKSEDYRPIIFNPKYPWWCTGFAITDDYKTGDAIIVAYLPNGENPFKYWPDAYSIDSEECEKIEFTSRFPKPDYFVESEEI